MYLFIYLFKDLFVYLFIYTEREREREREKERERERERDGARCREGRQVKVFLVQGLGEGSSRIQYSIEVYCRFFEVVFYNKSSLISCIVVVFIFVNNTSLTLLDSYLWHGKQSATMPA